MANPPYGDSSLDPTMPTYSTETFVLNSDFNVDDAMQAFNSTASTNVYQVRAIGVRTANADRNNGTMANVAPKNFPGLQS